jgi:hypothetical protein
MSALRSFIASYFATASHASEQPTAPAIPRAGPPLKDAPLGYGPGVEIPRAVKREEDTAPALAHGAAAPAGASSAKLMADLDADTQRAINDETDRIFFDTQKFPRDQMIPSQSHEMAPIWLAIRDGVMTGLSADPNAPNKTPGPEGEEAQQNERKQHLARVATYMKKVLNLKDDEIARLLLYTNNKAMAKEKDGKRGADKLVEALSGKSPLGKLSDDAKKGLLHEFAVKWLYSPGDKQDGARENLAKITAALKGDAKTAKMAAEAFNNISTSVPGNVFSGSNYKVLEKERAIQAELWGAAVDLDPFGTTQVNENGEGIAKRLLGHNEWHWIPGSRWEGNPDRYGQREPTPTESRRNAVINAVAHGALSPKETDKFFDRMFSSSSDYDVSPKDSIFGTAFDHDSSSEHEQESMGKLLGHVANRAHGKTEADAKFNDANMMEIMKSKGGREVLFSTSMPNAYRLWALDMMSADSGVPGKKPWTAKDLERGWESPVVVEAYAGAAVKQAQANFPQPWKVDATKDRGAMTNAVGQLLNIRPDKLPKQENDAQKRKREAEGFNHAIYDENEDPMKELLGHIGSGQAMVTAIPVTVINREDGAALFQVLRVQKEEKSPPFFLDDKGHRYDTVAKWKEDNKLPPGAMTYPKELTLGNPLETARTPSDSKGSRAAAIGDKAAMAAGAVAGVAILVGSGGTAAPLVAGAAAAYAGTRAVHKLADLHSLGHDLTDLHDDEIRGAYIDVASNAFAVGAMASAKLIGSMTAQGAKISSAGANLIAGLTWAGNLADAAGIADQINNLARRWKTMDEAERSKELISLGFAIGMKAAAVKKGGGLREQFDFKRIRNQIEHGTPFSVEKARPGELKSGETIAVKNENGKLTIVYEGAYPTKEMLALHSDAAVSMEASYTLKEKLKRMMGNADVDKPPPGSVAWEAVEELKKIRAELDSNLSKMNGADEKTRQALVARQVELNDAILKENARLDYWDQAGRGAVAAPAKGIDQAKKLGWDKVKLREGYSWVAGGDGEPHLFAQGKEKLYYDPDQKTFITKEERARLETIADRAGMDWFEKTFDTRSKEPIGPLVPDETITAKKGGMPDVHKPGMTKAQHAEALSAALGLKTEQMEALTEVMGKRVSKEFGAAWKSAAAKSQPAADALKKIRVHENLAAAAERAGDTKRAQKQRELASKLAKEAYDPVRGEFWTEVYANKKLRAQIEATGLTFEEGKAPYLKAPDPDKPGKFVEMQVTLEHFDRKTDVPLKAQDADNLLFSFRYENTVLLEHTRRIVRKQMGVNPGDPHPMN